MALELHSWITEAKRRNLMMTLGEVAALKPETPTKVVLPELCRECLLDECPDPDSDQEPDDLPCSFREYTAEEFFRKMGCLFTRAADEGELPPDDPAEDHGPAEVFELDIGGERDAAHLVPGMLSTAWDPEPFLAIAEGKPFDPEDPADTPEEEPAVILVQTENDFPTHLILWDRLVQSGMPMVIFTEGQEPTFCARGCKRKGY